jgi:hypothetical protein
MLFNKGFILPNGSIAVIGLTLKSKLVRALKPEIAMVGVNDVSLLLRNVLKTGDRLVSRTRTDPFYQIMQIISFL